MKKMVVMADSHRDRNIMKDIRKLEPDGDYYIHLGDSEVSKDDMDGWASVKGNNDSDLSYPDEMIFQVEKLRFYVCHGHLFGYYKREEKMIKKLIEKKCQVILYGHSHFPMNKEINGFYFINPGSTRLPRMKSKKSYCVILVDGDQLEVHFKEL